jgi:hypothetical protein
MNIPRFWEKVTTFARTPDDIDIELTAWGWSNDDRDHARRSAQERLARLVARVASGQLAGKRYPYSESSALREEIVEEVVDANDLLIGIITRNSYGSLVLNIPNVMFIDIDFPAPQPLSWLRALFRRKQKHAADNPTFARIREVLAQLTSDTFRIYRTAAGYRVLVTSRSFVPGSPEAEQLMRSLGADPNFIKLCRVQKSFRARVSPKPWRCGCDNPPARYPRTVEQQERFSAWVKKYDERSARTAVCRFLTQVGSKPLASVVGPLLRLHDDLTKAHSDIPLA